MNVRLVLVDGYHVDVEVDGFSEITTTWGEGFRRGTGEWGEPVVFASRYVVRAWAEPRRKTNEES